MKKEAFEKMMHISEKFFETANDSYQIPIGWESAIKLASIHKDTLVLKLDGEENPIGWAVVIPTSKKTMIRFLKKKITERELLDAAAAEKKFEALYICSVFVLEEHRRRGYARELVLRAIRDIPNGDRAVLYAWTYSKEGELLSKKLSADIGRPIIFVNKL